LAGGLRNSIEAKDQAPLNVINMSVENHSAEGFDRPQVIGERLLGTTVELEQSTAENLALLGTEC